ncbi:hypothetical protein PYW07_010736 [Mythimna separata]|uniref:Uncharacterized protein n=1 Tax=Mythimna separata TaxID=271217 RepID=A0AAD7Y7N2_MYTSE|nr:hypothetical protein PYW07_010736 [Mythimna separata]
MKMLICFVASLLVGSTYSAPTIEGASVVYTAEHDIVKILTPLNALNFEDDTDEDDYDEGSDTDSIIFLVLADIQENGDKVYQGLYMLKNRQATKLLDNGRDAAAASDDTKTAYFAAKDGIYSYNAAENQG